MNCWSNCPDDSEVGSDAGGALAGAAARMAWNSLIAGFGVVSADCGSAFLNDCARLESVDDCSPSLWRDPGTATTKNRATRAATPMAAAKRAATVHMAFFDSTGSSITSGSSG